MAGPGLPAPCEPIEQNHPETPLTRPLDQVDLYVNVNYLSVTGASGGRGPKSCIQADQRPSGGTSDVTALAAHYTPEHRIFRESFLALHDDRAIADARMPAQYGFDLL